MKKIVSIASSAVALVLSGSALAGGVDHMAPAATAVAPTSSSNFYVGVQGGYTMTSGTQENVINKKSTKPNMSDLYNNGFNAGGQVGYQMKGALPIRLEVAGNYYSLAKNKDKGDADFSAWDVMGNVYYDLNMGKFAPYLGVGVGYGNISLKGKSDTSSDGGLAYQGMAGINYSINDRIDLGVGYHLFASTIEVKDKSPSTNSYKFGSAMLHSFDVSMHYHFV